MRLEEILIMASRRSHFCAQGHNFFRLNALISEEKETIDAEGSHLTIKQPCGF